MPTERSCAMHANDWVEVRSKQEILETLDKNGRLDGMPFMPQMFEYCGKRFRVHKSAHKACDPVYTMAARGVDNAVHLNLRCNGEAYGGCQAGCRLFWKDAWLKPVSADEARELGAARRSRMHQDAGELPWLHRGGRVEGNAARRPAWRARRQHAICLPEHGASGVLQTALVVEPVPVCEGLCVGQRHARRNDAKRRLRPLWPAVWHENSAPSPRL